jgi:hypothetical protein
VSFKQGPVRPDISVGRGGSVLFTFEGAAEVCLKVSEEAFLSHLQAGTGNLDQKLTDQIVAALLGAGGEGQHGQPGELGGVLRPARTRRSRRSQTGLAEKKP